MLGENSFCVHGGSEDNAFVYTVKLIKQSLERSENIVPTGSSVQEKLGEMKRHTGGVNRVEIE